MIKKKLFWAAILFPTIAPVAFGDDLKLSDLASYFDAREQLVSSVDVEYEYTKLILPDYDRFLADKKKTNQIVNLSPSDKPAAVPTQSPKGFNIDQDIIYRQLGDKFYMRVDNLIVTPPARQEFYYNGLFEWQYTHNNNRVDIVGKPSTLPPLYDAAVFDLLSNFEAPPWRVCSTLESSLGRSIHASESNK